MATAWNRGVRKIWHLPFESHRNIMECENNIQMVKDLPKGIIGFNDDEIKNILDYVTTI